MIDLYLKASSEQDLIEQLFFARTDGEWIHATHEYTLDIIGIIYHNDATYDANGEILTPATLIDGYHANIRCNADFVANIPQSLIINPLTPSREWA